jgi:predicted nucleic acid-binding Zn ribbon protein
VRRPAPRPLGRALDQVVSQAAPAGLLARVQAVWPEVAGALVAEESSPEREQNGTVTVACRSSIWAQELELLGEDLRARLNGRLGPALDGGPVTRLRFVVGEP